jgi:glycosyltransferase involved in cell wall biosynthesis
MPEPFGIAFIEALYAGLPVVSSNFGGAAEIVDRSCGLLTAPGDDTQLAGALQQLLDDAGARRALGSAGPSRARNLCDPAQQMSRLHEALSGEGSQ